MLRKAPTIVASAVFSVALFALTASAMAMPPSETHDTGAGAPSTVQTVVDHSSTDTWVWIVGGVLIVALAASLIALATTYRHRNVPLRAARS